MCLLAVTIGLVAGLIVLVRPSAFGARCLALARGATSGSTLISLGATSLPTTAHRQYSKYQVYTRYLTVRAYLTLIPKS